MRNTSTTPAEAYSSAVERVATNQMPAGVNIRQIVSRAGKGMIQFRDDVEKYRREKLGLGDGILTR